MDARIVEHHNVRLRTDLGTEPIEKSDDIFLSRWPLDGAPDQSAVLIERTENIHALPMRLRFDGMGLIVRCPTIGNWWIGAEARLI